MIELGLRWLILGETQPWWIRFVFDAFFTFSRPQTCPKLLRNPMEYTREAPQAVWADFQNLDFSPKIVFVTLLVLLAQPLPGACRGRDRLRKWLPYVVHGIPERFYPTHNRFHATAPQTAQRIRDSISDQVLWSKDGMTLTFGRKAPSARKMISIWRPAWINLDNSGFREFWNIKCEFTRGIAQMNLKSFFPCPSRWVDMVLKKIHRKILKTFGRKIF